MDSYFDECLKSDNRIERIYAKHCIILRMWNEHRNQQEEGRHKRGIIALVQRRNNEVPVTCVAHNLSKLPPVTFDSIDVCVLLSRIEHVRLEMETLKKVVSTKTSV